jgi:predicted esterase
LYRILQGNRIVEHGVEGLIAPRNRWDNKRAINEIASRLKLSGGATRMIIIHGNEDEICPYNHGQELASLAQSLKPFIQSMFVTIPGGDHNAVIETGLTQVIRSLKSKL